MIVTEREREREAETQAEGEAGSMHREPEVGLDPESPGSCPGPKAGAKPLRHPGIPEYNNHVMNTLCQLLLPEQPGVILINFSLPLSLIYLLRVYRYSGDYFAIISTKIQE